MSEFQTQVYLDGYAPSFSNGAVVPVSLDGAGRQRVAAAYQTTRPTLVNNQTSGLQANSRGDLASVEQFAPQYEDNTNQVAWTAEKPLAVSTNAVSFLAGFSVTNLVVKASAGKLYKLVFTNGNAALRYLQIFNLTALPADTTVPAFSCAVPIGATFTLDLTQFGQYFSTGIVVCNSTTAATKTIGAADSLINAYYL